MRALFWGLLSLWELVKEMAWQAIIVILVVLLCRFFIGKISKQACYFLWGIVAFRLLCPVMLPSDFSIFNFVDTKNFESNIGMDAVFGGKFWGTDDVAGWQYLENQNITNTGSDLNSDAENTNINSNYNMVNEPAMSNQQSMADAYNNDEQKTLANTQTFGGFMSVFQSILLQNWTMFLWLFGMMAMFGYGFVSYIRLKHKLRFSTKAGDGIFESSLIASPFVLGIIKPVIYLPYHLNEQEKNYILRHEQYHIKRKDYLVKILAFCLLAVYWFHPLVWVSFYLMSRDMEISCDEQALKGMGSVDRKAYSTLLLSFARGKRMPLPSPLSFGENDTKSRIKQILNYKKPTFWGIFAAVILVIVVMVSCLTDAKDEKNIDDGVAGTENAVGELTEEGLLELATQLYEAKNPYLGNMSANGKILNLLWSAYGITGFNGTEMQTTNEPYWITIGFDTKPDDTAMWKVSAVFLALVENCNEVRWEYYDENQTLFTYYVSTDDVNALLDGNDIKEYAASDDTIFDLLVQIEDCVDTEVSSWDDAQTHTLAKATSWERYAEMAGIEWNVRNQLESRMISDGIAYRGEMQEVRGCVYQDFDNSGTMDLAVYVADMDWEDAIDGRLYVYMNEDPVYVQEMEHAYDFAISAGDIDHDGNMELVYIGNTGGNGGSGSFTKGILKYKDNSFTMMELPGDFSGEEKSYGDAGYHLEIAFASEDGQYQVSCPSIGKSQVIQSAYTTYEDGSLFQEPVAGVVVGAECRGYFELGIIQEDGKDYLFGKEYFYGEGGVNDGKGEVKFVFDWDGEQGWIVKGFDAIPYNTVIRM